MIGDHRGRLLEGKVTIVTGASRGIGAAAARAFAAEGASVVLAARSAESLQSIAEEIDAGGGQALAVPVDVSEPASVESLVRQTLDAFGRLDGAFNNAADGPPPTPLADLPVEGFDHALAVNLQHHQCGFFATHGEHSLEHDDDKVHRRVIIVQQNDLEQRRRLDPRPLGFENAAILLLCGHRLPGPLSNVGSMFDDCNSFFKGKADGRPEA